MECVKPIISYKIKKGQKAEFVKFRYKETKERIINQEREKYQLLDCRKCPGCKQKEASEWATRIYCESKKSKNKYFITLTYQNETQKTLNWNDIKEWIKKIKKIEPKTKYFISGEYGKKTHRPHYHAIILNLEINDLKEWEKKAENKIYWSPTIKKTWNKGISAIGKVTEQSIAYTTMYTTKKLTNSKYIEKNKLEKEAHKQSRGLGKDWIIENYKEAYKNDQIHTTNGIKKIPRYFDRVIEKINKEIIEKTKEKRAEQTEKKHKENEKYYKEKGITNIQRLKNKEIQLKQKINKTQKK